MERKIAFITGASRGIGAAACVALAKAGFDIVATARTIKEGEGRVKQPTTGSEAGALPVKGSLETTAAAVRALGREALTLPLDLTDKETLESAVERTLAEWGHIDVLLNNGIWSGPGLLDPIQDLSLEVLEKAFLANTFHQLYLTQLVLPGMRARQRGVILNMTSSAGEVDEPPYSLVKMGMLGFAHCATKGAFHRMAPLLQAEYADDGILAINVDPGFTWGESMEALGLPQLGAAPPEVSGEAIAWLASDPAASEWGGRTVHSQRLCADLGRVAGWPPDDPSWERNA